MHERNDNLPRREFFRKVAAGVALAALGGLAAFLGTKRVKVGAAPTCTYASGCRACPALGQCALSQALADRQVLGREGRP